MANTYTALETHDGPWTCWDVVLPAWEIAQLKRAGYIQIDPEHQRGKNAVSGKPIIDQKKIDRWAEQLAEGDAVLGQLTLNYRKDDGRTNVQYDDSRHELKIEGIAFAPDSAHRILSIVEADDSASRGSGFDPQRKVSVRIYSINTEEEDRVFYALNQEGSKADSTRSKYLHPTDLGQRLAKALVEASPHLGRDNVNTMQDRLSKRDPRLVAFNTISKAIETAWRDAKVDADNFDDVVSWLVSYWDRLVSVRPELGKVDLETRQFFRESTTAATALAVHGYLALAYELWSRGLPLETIDALNDTEWFAKENPMWVERGVLVPETNSKGVTRLAMRNALQTRTQFARALLAKVGLGDTDEAEALEQVEEAHTKEDAVAAIAKAVGVSTPPPMSIGSTEPKEIFLLINDHLGLGLDASMSKPKIARAIVEMAGLPWDDTCDSLGSPSGGGSTVTLTGLNRVLAATAILKRRHAA